MTNNSFTIKKNNALISEANDAISKNIPSEREEKILYYNELDSIENKIHQYKKETFVLADTYLENKHCGYVEVILDKDIEDTILNIMKRKKEIWSNDSTKKIVIRKSIV